MNEGVKILIERMESNPEDFYSSDFEPTTGRITRGRYVWIADYLKKRLAGTAEPWYMEGALTPEEMEALMAAYIQFERKRFTERVMKDLLVNEEPQKSYTFQPAMTLSSNGNLGLGTAPLTFVSPSLQLGTQKLTEHDVETLTEMIGKWRGEDDGAI